MNVAWKTCAGVITACLFVQASASGQTARKDLEDAAAKLRFYSVNDFYTNAVPQPFMKEYHDRLASLRKQDYAVKDLVELLKHDDARVRTLAAHLIFHRRDPKLLPHLAGLAKDKAQTFGRPRPSATGAFFNKDLPGMDKQTVGDVASSMVMTYLSPAGYHNVEPHGPCPGFDVYWAKHKDREYCASWFWLELARASRNSNPQRPEWKPDILEVRKRIDKIPEPDRTFTLLFLRDNPGGEVLVSKDELIEMCKKVGPEKLMQLVLFKIPSDDPDLQSRPNNNTLYVNMVRYVLANAKALLRPEDADMLIQQGPRHEPTSGALTPPWFIAAVELQPGKTKEVLAKAWTEIAKTKPPGRSDNPVRLAEAMWKRYGDDSRDFAVNLFYYQQLWPGEIPHARDRFLSSLGNAWKQPERSLIAAIIRDKRFDTLDWQSLSHIGWIVNAWHSEEIFTRNDLENTSHPLGRGKYHSEMERAQKEFPRETEALEKTLKRWRETLRKVVSDPPAKEICSPLHLYSGGEGPGVRGFSIPRATPTSLQATQPPSPPTPLPRVHGRGESSREEFEDAADKLAFYGQDFDANPRGCY
jgi:hypothetical protein